jgi:hypothetical protein
MTYLMAFAIINMFQEGNYVKENSDAVHSSVSDAE